MSAEVPVAVVLAAGGAGVDAPFAAAPHAFFEVAAGQRSVVIFARRREIAVVAAAMPFVALADRTLEARLVNAELFAPVVAVHVAGDLVARHAAEEHAADGRRRASAAMAELAADDAADDGAADRADRSILVVAIFAVIIGVRRARAATRADREALGRQKLRRSGHACRLQRGRWPGRVRGQTLHLSLNAC